MGKIVILDENTSNKIAAGEVIEKPASVIKELVENSIDAGATSISVEVRNGGISFIKVTDNGSGIDEDDVEIAFERHATSKIRSSNDLETIATMGFRGEALASIASVSTVEVTTRVKKNPHGTYIKIQGGTVKEVKQTGCPVGTTFAVRDLFYNTPARFKFLKKDSTEFGYISDIINRIALGTPAVAFKLVNNNSVVLHTPGNNDLLSTIYTVYGKDTAKSVLEVDYSDSKLKITGYIGKPEIARATRSHQSIYINGRYIRSKVITSAIDEAYKTFLMKNKYPFVVLNVEVNPLLVDVNVHPTKMEVRFAEEQEIFRSIYHAVSNALLGKQLIKTVQIEEKNKNPFKIEHSQFSNLKYSQGKIEINKEIVREPERSVYIKETSNPSRNNYTKAEDNNTGVQDVSISKVVNAAKTDIPLASIPVKEQKTENCIKLEKAPVEINTVTNIESNTRTIIDTAKAAESVRGDEKPLQVKQSLFTDVKIIGQAFSTYILLQQENELVVIDQHAAHERVMYEKLKRKYVNEENLAQMLLAPEVIELTHPEIRFLDEKREFFNKLGFIYESFGNNSIILRAVPNAEDKTSIKEMFLEVLDSIMSNGKEADHKAADDTLYTISCKAAVKANKRLDDREIKSVLNELEEIENPYTCPHGRPTIIKLTKYELEKMFKRIV